MTRGPTRAATLHMIRMNLRASAMAAVVAGLAGAAQAETLKAHYALSLMGISIGNAYASGVLDRNYRIDISMRTTGLANLVNNTKGAATASGGLTAAGPSPAAYANTTSNEEDVRTVRMSLASNAVRMVEVKPEPWDADQRIPVTDGNKRRVVDPVSALIMSVPQGQELTGPAACNRTIAVFDGVTRFDVALSYAGERSASTAGYSGPVAVCSARYTPIAGHRPDSKSTRYMAENRDMNVWLAPLPESRVVVPIHIDVKTGAGDLVIEASDFQVGAKRADTRR
ncbi:DUF3108 domain-containing protein [Methylocystis echinoides]|uniref:DUF3108 domain-containing protein n=1 Tax=Methylocystis echinoides TaxID=29468 RepID=A0A9W6GT04_9HYPH|nr:hypothetical protein LMG27198_15290 [Methylocystis echinoides]